MTAAGLVLPFGEHRPTIAADAVTLVGSTVVGQVTLGPRASVWYGAVVRADAAPVVIGAGTNLQDGVIVHADPGFPAEIGDRVTVGHGAVVHGAVVEDDCIIGMGAVVLNGARIGRGSILAAGSVVRQNAELPAHSLVAGAPAAVKRPVSEGEVALIDGSWRHYVELAAAHARTAVGTD